MHPQWSLSDGITSGVSVTTQVLDATPVTALTAPTAGQVFYLCDIIAVNADSSIRTLIVKAGSTIMLNLPLAANCGGYSHSFKKPLKCAAGNITIYLGNTAVTETSVFLNGFWLPS